MSERKVLNKYYPPDFDPSKIPRTKRSNKREFNLRLMAPCNMKCTTCGEYIAKAKKFNARKEDVENENYLGIRIYRFYIKCPGCVSEISFRTDPGSTDYVIEAGAHRNFQALRLAEEQALKEEREAKEEIESNPMLLLENRTQQSQLEMEVLESLEDLRELNERHAGVNIENMTKKYEEERKLTKEKLEMKETEDALKFLGYEDVDGKLIKRLNPTQESQSKKIKVNNGLSIAAPAISSVKSNKQSMKAKMSGIVKLKDNKSKLSTNETVTPTVESNMEKNTEKEPLAKNQSVQNPPKPSGLSLLGSYDDSSGSCSD